MTLRPWLMPEAAAGRLTALVRDVNSVTGLPEPLILGALVDVACRHRDEVEAEARSAGGSG